jgi:hypothetical protein
MTAIIHHIPLIMHKQFAEWATLIQQTNEATKNGN